MKNTTRIGIKPDTKWFALRKRQRTNQYGRTVEVFAPEDPRLASLYETAY